MQISYSPLPVDALDIVLIANGRTHRMVKLAPTCNLDMDAKGRLIAIEILNASGWYPKAVLIQLPRPEPEWRTLRQASAEARRSVSTLRTQIRRGRIPARKQGRRWLIARHELWNYLERCKWRSAIRRCLAKTRP